MVSNYGTIDLCCQSRYINHHCRDLFWPLKGGKVCYTDVLYNITFAEHVLEDNSWVVWYVQIYGINAKNREGKQHKLGRTGHKQENGIPLQLQRQKYREINYHVFSLCKQYKLAFL